MMEICGGASGEAGFPLFRFLAPLLERKNLLEPFPFPVSRLAWRTGPEREIPGWCHNWKVDEGDSPDPDLLHRDCWELASGDPWTEAPGARRRADNALERSAGVWAACSVRPPDSRRCLRDCFHG